MSVLLAKPARAVLLIGRDYAWREETAGYAFRDDRTPRPTDEQNENYAAAGGEAAFYYGANRLDYLMNTYIPSFMEPIP